MPDPAIPAQPSQPIRRLDDDEPSMRLFELLVGAIALLAALGLAFR